MSFRTIRTDFNGVFLCLQCCIAAVNHDEECRCCAGGHPKSGLIRTETRCSTATIDNDIMALMIRPSALSAPTLTGFFYAYNAVLQPPTTMRRVDVVLAATPNLASSGLRRRCSHFTIDNDSMALMLCPSALFAPTLMGYWYAYNAVLQPSTTMRRVDVVLAATPNLASLGLRHAVAPPPSIMTSWLH